MIDERLKKFGTPRQNEIIDKVNECGSASETARLLGISRSTVRSAIDAVKQRAARHGLAPDDAIDNITAPYVARGKSILYDGDGKAVMTWVKTKLDDTLARDAIVAWVDWLVEEARGLHPASPAPEHMVEDLLSVYPMGDPHFGMYAWGKETGAPFDLDIAEKLTRSAIDRLVASAPATHTALILELGDFFHADNNSSRTPNSGAQLDTDSRWQKVIQVGLRSMIHVIQRTLEKHAEVVVRIVQGNHDPHSSVALAFALDAYFHSEPRVKIDLSPNPYWYFRFGQVLIGATHGDMCKTDKLPAIMATDRPQDWGATTQRYFYHGHIHHDSVKEGMGCMIESFRTLAGKDAWHNASGYRSGRDMKVIVHHKDFGEVERHRVDIAQL
jgi:NAD(P)-dependent dehydrogenase (short-subunit alcohol dehydrogenase family)